METTGKAFIEHWNWAAEKGLMNRNTAAGLRSASAQVLSILETWETLDMKDLDMEDTLKRFQNLKAKDFKPAVLETYKRRFRQAVKSYLDYASDPGGWKPRTLERTVSREKSNGSERVVEKPERVAALRIPQTNLVDYPFPVRDGVIAHLVLPRDLKASEAKRLNAFVSTLVVDAAPVE